MVSGTTLKPTPVGQLTHLHPHIHARDRSGVPPKRRVSAVAQAGDQAAPQALGTRGLRAAPGRREDHRGGRGEHPSRNIQVFDPLDFLAKVTQHLPEPAEHLIRYYGWYPNKTRGQRVKRQPPAGTPIGA